MNKARRLLSTVFVSALLLLIGIMASPDDCFAAGGASGTFGEVPWQVTTDGVLQIGDDGGEYELPSTIGGNNWPWYGERGDIKSVEVRGTIHGHGSIRGMFYGFRNCSSMNLSGFDTSNVTDMGDMFIDCKSLSSLDISGFDTSNVTNMSGMFCDCTNLSNLNISGFNTSNVTTMFVMFSDCSSLTRLILPSGFDTSNVTNMSGMFQLCTGLTELDLSGFNTSSVTDMGSMFEFCESLTELDLSGFNTSNVTKMEYMFCGCYSLTEITTSNLFNTSNVSEMYGMFSSCSSLISLDVSGFNTEKVTDMSSMFAGCSSLTSLNVSNFNTSKVTNMQQMFDGCSSLTSLNVSNFDTSKTSYYSMKGMFDRCIGLRTLTTPNWSSPTATLPTFPLKMKNAGTEYAAGATFPAVASTTYEACEIIINGNVETTVPKETFEEIAGKDDMDLLIQGTDIQWTFHGSDVAPGSGKDIDVTTRIHKEKGEDVGFADDSQVLVIDFADNGQLPGEAEIQIVNNYISEEKASGTEQLKLSYVRGSQINLEDGNVKIQGNNTAVFKINHNSRFVLSAAVRSIGSATVIVSNCIYNGKEQKPSITVKLRGKKLDPKYYSAPQYSANKAVGTATVRVTGNSDFGYKGTATGTFYINPKQAKISKLKVGKKKITVKMKTKPASLGATKYLIEYRIAGTGNWKSITAKGKSKVIKKLKKRKKYEVRVIAVNGARKGPASATKRSKKIK